MKRDICSRVIDGRLNLRSQLRIELTRLAGGVAVSAALLAAADPAAAKVFMTFVAGASHGMTAPAAFPKTWQVEPGQTLRTIAAQLAPTDDKATREQIEQALFNANPHAFIDGKADRLRQDVALSIPDEIATLGHSSQAISAVAHNTAASASVVVSPVSTAIATLATAPISTSAASQPVPSLSASSRVQEGTRLTPEANHFALETAAAQTVRPGETAEFAAPRGPWDFSRDWALAQKKWYAWLDNPLSMRLLEAVAAGLLALLFLILLGGLTHWWHWRANRGKVAGLNPAAEPALAHQADSVVQPDEAMKVPPSIAALDLTLPDLPEEPTLSNQPAGSPDDKVETADPVQTTSSSIPPSAPATGATGISAALLADKIAQPRQPGAPEEPPASLVTAEHPHLALAREYIALGTVTQARARALLEELLSSSSSSKNDPAILKAARALLDTLSRAA